MSRPKAKRIARLIRKTEHRAEQAERSKVAITWICEGCKRYQMVFIPSITPSQRPSPEGDGLQEQKANRVEQVKPLY